MNADLVSAETGKTIGSIRYQDILPRKSEVLYIKQGKKISKFSVESVEWNYEINTSYPKDSLIFHCPKIWLNHIVSFNESQGMQKP